MDHDSWLHFYNRSAAKLKMPIWQLTAGTYNELVRNHKSFKSNAFRDYALCFKKNRVAPLKLIIKLKLSVVKNLYKHVKYES